MTLPAWLLLHFAVGVSATWLARRYALRRELLDQPGERRSHAAPTPRGGGISIVLALLLAVAWAWAASPSAAWLPWFGGGLLLVAGVGLVDDHRPLSPWLRLGVQAAAAACLAAASWVELQSPGFALLAFLAAMVLANAWNFMDGIDGIAASQALLVALAIAALAAGPVRWIALALAAAVAGFLPFNVPRASVFLGDVGSGALGFAVAALAVRADGTQYGPAWLLALPLSAFLVDTGLTLLGRVLRGEPWWRPHVLHAYQRWVRRCGRHMPVTLAYAGWTIASMALLFALLRWEVDVPATLAACVAWYMTGAGAWWMLQRKRTDAAMENLE